MTFTLVGYYESQAATGLTQVAALVDNHINAVGDNIRVPGWADKIMAVYDGGIGAVQAQVSSPSLQAHLLLDVTPVNVGATEPANPTPLDTRLPHLIPLVPGEDMRFLHDNAGAAEPQYGLVWLMDQVDPLPPGKIHTVRLTGAITAVADTWTNGAMVFSQQLEAGKYAIVGMQACGPTLVAARLIIPGSAHRPGVTGEDTEAHIHPEIFRKGKSGLWGTFEHTFPPQLEILCTAADVAQIVHLDLIGPL